MKTRKLLYVLLMLTVFVSLFAAVALPASAAEAPTKYWIEPSETNDLPVQIDVFEHEHEHKVQTGTYWGQPIYETTYTYTYELYLPGNVNAENCRLSWDGGAQATVGGVSYESGECPIPAPGAETETEYTFKSGTTTLSTLALSTFQGSADVRPIFIVIDEEYMTDGDTEPHTIAAMDGDPDHEKYCVGTIYINGKRNDMDKIKGRGNWTWTKSKDKRAYNITLGKKITINGLDSEKTKKWTILSEIGDRSLLCNRTGFKLAHELGVGQDTISADVWMNGEYQGCYTVTPKTDSFVPDGGFMIENDNYEETLTVAEGGDPQFKLEGLNGTSATAWDNCITVKEIGDDLLKVDGKVDDSAENVIRVANYVIKPWLQDAWDAIRSDTGYNSDGKYYTDYIDIESFAKMYLMHEYVKSYDVCAGSIIFHRDGMTENDKLIAGPIWDLDNALGSTQTNSSLGSVGDRRSGKGAFIPNIREYKTSIFKTLYTKHEDFREEVVRQYNLNRDYFDALPGDVQALITEIDASANMNHKKVLDISDYNLHKYDSEKTFEAGTVYEQTMNATTEWANYAANLKTYVTARTLWFENTYYDPDFVDPSNCDHQYERVSYLAATCTADGYASYTCPICKDSYTEVLPKIAHDYQYNADDECSECTVCGERLLTATIDCDEGATVTVYETQNFDGACEEDATIAYPRDSKTGLIDCAVSNGEGSGQINFVVNLKPGYELVGVTATGGYKNLKGPADTEVENGYRITKVSGDVTISVQTLSTTPPEPVFKTKSLLLSGQIGVNFFMDLSMLTDEEKAASYMEFTVNDATVQVDLDEGFRDNNTANYYGFTCYVNSVQMADNIHAVFHYGTDSTVETDYSVAQYLSFFDENSGLFGPKLLALIQALGDYGHYEQPFLAESNNWTIGVEHEEMTKYYTEAYDLDSIKGEVQGYTFVKNIEGSGITKATYRLLLDSETSVDVFLTPAEETEVTASASFNGKTYDAVKQSDGRYRIRITGISAHQLGDTITVTGTAGSGFTATVSALSYVRSVLNNDAFNEKAKNAMAALYKYYDAVMKYRQN